MTAALAMLLAMGTRWKFFYLGSVGLFVAGMVAMFAGFGMRLGDLRLRPGDQHVPVGDRRCAGHGPVRPGLRAGLPQAVHSPTAAACVSTLALILADNCPAHLDPTIVPCSRYCGATIGWSSM